VPTDPKTDSQQHRDRVVRRLYNRLISLSVVCVVACLVLSLTACSSDSSEPVRNETTENQLAGDEPTEGGLSEAETPVQTTGNQTDIDQPATTPPQMQIS